MMYKCSDCGLVFDNPKVYSEDRTPYGGMADPGFTETYTGCPSCGGNYDEAMKCVRCDDEYISTESRYPFCEGCLQDLITVYCEVMSDNFRPDEYEAIYDLTDGLSYEEILNKKKGE